MEAWKIAAMCHDRMIDSEEVDGRVMARNPNNGELIDVTTLTSKALADLIRDWLEDWDNATE